MEPHHETGFPTTLCRWVREIVQSSPEAARLTLLELIVGALLASGGHVTQAILALTPRLGWQAYHWMLERGQFRLLGLISALCRIVRREIGARRCFVVIDDTLAPRCSARAPGVAVRLVLSDLGAACRKRPQRIGSQAPVLSNQECDHGLPALPLVVDHRARGPNGSWFPALSLPGLRAAVQRADRHGAEPGPGPDRHRVPGGLLEIALQVEPA